MKALQNKILMMTGFLVIFGLLSCLVFILLTAAIVIFGIIDFVPLWKQLWYSIMASCIGVGLGTLGNWWLKKNIEKL